MDSDDENSLEKALALERAVLRYNDINAMINLGRLLLYNEQFVSQRARGLQMLERAIKQAQHPFAMYSVADYLLTCKRREDHCRAYSLLERSMKLKENPYVLTRLGYCYVRGKGVAKDVNVAAQLCERALRLKQEPYIMGCLAWALLNAPNLHAQKKRALALYKKAIELTSDAEMMNDLGLLYHNGCENLSACTKKASKWYLRAIQTSEYPSAMYNLAVLLLNNEPSEDQVKRAISLLEDAMKLEEQKDVVTIVKLAEAYSEHRIDVERALELYETAAIHFNSQRARSALLGAWIDGMGGQTIKHTRIQDFCWRDFKQNDDNDSLVVFSMMTWTGTRDNQMDPKKAVQLLTSNRWTGHGSLSLVLRHDLDKYPHGRKNAERLMKKFDDEIDPCNLKDLESIVFSERSCDGDKLSALESFRKQRDVPSSLDEITWLVPHLRVGRRILPFDGDPDWVTNVMRRFSRWKYISSLNLASLLLEIDGKQQKAVAVLEDLMNSDLRVIAMLNLAYILINDVDGVKKDVGKGMQLLEDAVKETNEVSARAMLANALSEGPDSDAGDVEKGWKLWCSVEKEVEEEEELRKVRRLISQRSEKKWSALGFRKGQERTEKFESNGKK